MRRLCLITSLLAVCLFQGLALEPPVYSVDVRVTTSASPPQISLSWPQVSYAREYVIRRKSLSDQSWTSTLATLPGNSTGFTDSGISVGVAYEYAVEMATTFYPYPGGDPSQWVNAYSYVCSGINLPLKDQKGKVLLLVDQSMAGAIQSELATFQQDLVGAGWIVLRREVSRTTPVVDVRNLIRAEYNADPTQMRSVILVGHVPVPYSGNIAPDLHESHRGAWPADAFYGEMHGSWTDHIVSVSSYDSQDNDNFPGDGKFDQSSFPSPVDLEVGRIDFWKMTSFLPLSEADLLKRYFQKNRQFRHRSFTAARQGLIRDNFGDVSGDAPSVDAWRHFGLFFGPDKVRVIGPDTFFSTLNNESFLWSYGSGGGGYKKVDNLGSTPDFAINSPKSVFMILHGSYFGDWNNEDNFLRAAIGSPGYTLASIWSGLPHWYMHHMALGETVGYSTRVTQNNINLYKSHQNFAAGEVHISLIGDPTLEMFPVVPPSNITGQPAGSGVALTWSPSGENGIVGYHVYHSANSSGPYQRLTTAPVAATSYDHSVATGTHHYMVRAVKLETTGSGSFYNASQGIFTTVSKTGNDLPVVSISVISSDFAEDGPAAAVARITRNIVNGNPLSVSLTFSGNALNGTDFELLPSAVVIPASEPSVDLVLVPVEDGIVEGDENVTISIQSSTTYAIGTDAVSLILKDSEVVNQPPAISPISDITILAGASSDPIPFTIVDPDTPAAELSLRAASSAKHIILPEDVEFGGEGENRTLKVSSSLSSIGQAKITVIVSDGSLEAMRNFHVDVEPANEPPVALPQHVEVDEDSSLSIVLSGSDPEGSSLEFFIAAEPAHGTVAGTAPNLVYTPVTNYSGSDTLSFYVSDGEHESDIGTITIDILPVNDLPVAVPDEFVTVTGHPLIRETSLLLANDLDLEGAVLFSSAELTSLNGGTVTIEPPNFIYSPATDFVGKDSFNYTIEDSDGGSATALVLIEVLQKPRIVSINAATDGSLLLQLQGIPNSAFKVYAATPDFVWSELGSGETNSEGYGEFIDPLSQLRARYYIAEWED